MTPAVSHATPARRAVRLPCALAVLALACVTLPAQAATLFVNSEKDDAITLIDMGTLTVQGTVATCKRPRHMQLGPDRTKLYVACTDSHEADVIDVATRKSVGRLPLGEDPEAFDFSPDGKTLYVSNEEEGALSMIDVASGKRLRSVEVGEEPEGVKVSPDGKSVYVTSEVASLVHVIDTASGKVVKNIKVGKRPRRFAITPDGSELWVTSELGASVSVISTRDMKVIDTIQFEVKGVRSEDITPVGIAFTRDGKRAFVGLGKANRVAFVEVASRKVQDEVLVGKRAWNVTLNADESRLFVVNGLSDDLTVIDVAAVKAIKTIPVGRVPYIAVVVE
jgi:PQQ-dependent catabolism-associated beta-propeller protein